jgi:hypothetical protein
VIVAIVRTGTLYGFEYVVAMRNMIRRHLKLSHAIVCFTDQPERCEGVTFIDTAMTGLTGWWAKLLIFEPSWRDQHRVIYLDLDTVIIGDLAPLASVPGEFAILQSPVRRLLKDQTYPCRYNSSVMVLGGGMARFIWTVFIKRQAELMANHARYGDQAAIEELYPHAPFLQDKLPGFFINYRNLTMHKPDAAVVNFGGPMKPHKCQIPWVREAWQ